MKRILIILVVSMVLLGLMPLTLARYSDKDNSGKYKSDSEQRKMFGEAIERFKDKNKNDIDDKEEYRDGSNKNDIYKYSETKEKFEGLKEKYMEDKDAYKEEFEKYKEDFKILKDQYKDKINEIKEKKEELKSKKEEVKEIKDKIKDGTATDKDKKDYVDYTKSALEVINKRLELLKIKFGNLLLSDKVSEVATKVAASEEVINDILSDGKVTNDELNQVKTEISNVKTALSTIKGEVKEKLKESKMERLNGILANVRAVIASLERTAAAMDAKEPGAGDVARQKITKIREFVRQIEDLINSGPTDDKDSYGNQLNSLLGQLKEEMAGVIGDFRSGKYKSDFPAFKKNLMEEQSKKMGRTMMQKTEPEPIAAPADE